MKVSNLSEYLIWLAWFKEENKKRVWRQYTKIK